MKLLKRIGYYLIGVSLGSIVVIFIWKGKDVSFDYGMDARTLSSIRKRQLVYTESVKQKMVQFDIDTATISAILNNKADIDFSKSKAQLKPCAEYHITAKKPLQNISFYIKRCDSIATIEKVWKRD